MGKKMEEMECQGLLEERRVREKRDMCVALQKRFSQLCGGLRKRAITEGCGAVMEEMESSECGGDLQLKKRAPNCPEGWSGRAGVCYKYFSDPMTFAKASKTCKSASKDKSSQLATIESMLVETNEDRKFFSDLIQSSGAVEHIDSVLSTMDDMFEGKNWNEVKAGQGDWARKEPSHDNDLRMDNGHCVVYFYNKKSGDSALTTDIESVQEVKAWWNANCNLELPFLCEVRAS